MLVFWILPEAHNVSGEETKAYMRRTVWIVAEDSVLSVSPDVVHLQGYVWSISEHGFLGQALLEIQCVCVRARLRYLAPVRSPA